MNHTRRTPAVNLYDNLLLMTLVLAALIALAANTHQPTPDSPSYTSSFAQPQLDAPLMSLASLPKSELKNLYFQFIGGVFVDQHGRRYANDVSFPAWSCEGKPGLVDKFYYWVALPFSGTEFREMGCA
jgi:hypothetical protein